MEGYLLTIGILFMLYEGSYCELYRHDYYCDQAPGGWLKFNPIPHTWEEAALRCYNEGAILASPLDEEFSKTLSNIMIDHGLLTTPIFTGISNVYARSEYQTMEGVPISNLCISWSAEPNIKPSDQNCIAMNTNGTVTALSCLDRHPFVCYRKSGVQLNECGAVDNGFVLDNRTGSCYKAFNMLSSWPESFAICAREGAYLAVINSDTEAEVIWDLAKKVLAQTPVPSWSYVNIGFRSWSEPRTWMTIHGQSLKDAGYDKWSPNEPNHEHERCGTLFAGSSVKDGVLNDGECHVTRKFICELDPKINAAVH
ncbi:hypothetical protein ABMA27_014397 [Loxostege sticticalis]|uniref:C-type lectin domain-containing protein n=1 Tax=Loxostege sticticalis TaxID=481309 RepID=A0ABR3I8S1_LOXSC